MSGLFFRLFLVFELTFSGFIPPSKPRPVTADWCQCVIFVLNLMGIEQIPGEYWTAASLAEPDKSGSTWMEYQGFNERPDGELPQPGDLLVLADGAEVTTVQTWDGTEHLVPVVVDVWAGHIGIIENAQKVTKEGNSYLQITLLSANWGVNARPSGVVGSCYNVDESIFLIPESDKMSKYFYASDLLMMRERVINRAKRWSSLGITPNPQVTLDGFPLTPEGFISAALNEPDVHPLTPDLISEDADLVEIFDTAAQPGDVVILNGEEGNVGYGIIAGSDSSKNTSRDRFMQVISMLPDGRVTGPETWNLIRRDDVWIKVFPDTTFASVRYYRYNKLPGYPVPGKKGISWVNDYKLHGSISFSLTNAGGKDIEVENLMIEARARQNGGQKNTTILEFPKQSKILLKAGEIYVYSYSPNFPAPGEYDLDIHYEWQNNPVIIDKAITIQVE